MIRSIRDEALELLTQRGSILDLARDLTRLMREGGFEGGVIGGVAVVLHGHIRTTVDVDLFIPRDAEKLAEELKNAGFEFDPSKKEFRRDLVPVHFVMPNQVRLAPTAYEEIDGVWTVCLTDLINMKLDSGLRNVLRAQDLADVIGLMRHHRLTSEFTPKIAKALRPDFRKLVRSLAEEKP